MTTPTIAASAYASLARISESALAPAKVAGGAAGPSFSGLLKDALGAVLETGRKSDAQQQALAARKANLVDVVTAVSETEVAVQTLVSVRDRVISAYEEIMRMQI